MNGDCVLPDDEYQEIMSVAEQWRGQRGYVVFQRYAAQVNFMPESAVDTAPFTVDERKVMRDLLAKYDPATECIIFLLELHRHCALIGYFEGTAK